MDYDNYHLVMTNSLPWKDPPCLSSVNHLFRLGPSKSHGKMLNNQRVYIIVMIIPNRIVSMAV